MTNPTYSYDDVIDLTIAVDDTACETCECCNGSCGGDCEVSACPCAR